jgi:hypothetical protein
MTVPQLEAAFHTYLGELLRVRDSKAYWPVLHMLLSLPDICAGLERPSGATSGDLYVAWCDRYLHRNLSGANLRGSDWYRLRCAVLHLGSSLPDQKRGKHRSQYDSFSFVDPDSGPPGHVHGQTLTRGNGYSNITLDIAVLADSMARAIRLWFIHVANPGAPEAVCVTKNISVLVRQQPKDFVIGLPTSGPGFLVVNHRGIAISST